LGPSGIPVALELSKEEVTVTLDTVYWLTVSRLKGTKDNTSNQWEGILAVLYMAKYLFLLNFEETYLILPDNWGSSLPTNSPSLISAIHNALQRSWNNL
jgi:hypothetical protein